MKVAAFSQELVIHAFEDNGSIVERMAIPLPNKPAYGEFISLGETDNYIFAYGTGQFCLVSLENKRVELSCSEVN